jgi:hypothetical protein
MKIQSGITKVAFLTCINIIRKSIQANATRQLAVSISSTAYHGIIFLNRKGCSGSKTWLVGGPYFTYEPDPWLCKIYWQW